MRRERIQWAETGAPREEILRDRLIASGFDAFRWRDEPDAVYQPHAHDHHESLWVIDGEITFGIDGRDYHLGPGDRLMLPAHTVHAARVGTRGATYFIGQRSASTRETAS